jgi:hypothetical protein
MTSFKKLWTTFVDALKPEAIRNPNPVGLHSIYIDTRPFNVGNFSSRER